MRFDVVTLFPPLVEQVARFGVVSRGIETGAASLHTWNPRDFTADRHRTVDDRSYGGGPGMVMKVEPLRDAVRAAKADGASGPVVCLSPQGERFSQGWAERLAGEPALTLICGRYEGFDERFVRDEVDLELSLGDFVLSGGELPAMAVVDACVRLLPGVLGHADSAGEDSFAEGLLDHPHYTRPEHLADGGGVPEVLLSGDHARIRQWRLKQALGRTWLRRPELLDDVTLGPEAQRLLQDFIEEQAG